MTSFEEVKDSIKFKLDSNFHTWMFVVNVYDGAYKTAFRCWEATMRRQKESDKLTIDLALTALSLCSGTILTAAFSGVALKTIAGNKVLDFICKHNMRRAFNASYWIEQNNTARFIVGSLWDHAVKKGKDILSTETRAIITGLGKQFSDAKNLAPYPELVGPPMKAFVNQCARGVNNACVDIVESKENEDKKTKAFTALLSSSYCNPTAKLQKDLAKRIELSFYLRMVMDSVRSVHSVFTHSDWGSKPVYGWKTTHREPIKVPPNHLDFPKNGYNDTLDDSTELRHVEYGLIGQEIIEQMNKRCKEVFGDRYPYVVKSPCCGKQASNEILDRAYEISGQLGFDNWVFIKSQIR